MRKSKIITAVITMSQSDSRFSPALLSEENEEEEDLEEDAGAPWTVTVKSQ